MLASGVSVYVTCQKDTEASDYYLGELTCNYMLQEFVHTPCKLSANAMLHTQVMPCSLYCSRKSVAWNYK